MILRRNNPQIAKTEAERELVYQHFMASKKRSVALRAKEDDLHIEEVKRQCYKKYIVPD